MHRVKPAGLPVVLVNQVRVGDQPHGGQNSRPRLPLTMLGRADEVISTLHFRSASTDLSFAAHSTFIDAKHSLLTSNVTGGVDALLPSTSCQLSSRFHKD